MTTKRRLLEPPLNEIEDYDALGSIWSALEGDSGRLAIRLRDGSATPAECRLAADLIEGGKSKRPRRRSSRHEQYKIAQYVALIRKVYPKAPKKIAICAAREHFKQDGREPSERHVHNVLKKFDDDALSEFERMYRNSTPILVPEERKRVREALKDVSHDLLVEIIEGFLARN